MDVYNKQMIFIHGAIKVWFPPDDTFLAIEMILLRWIFAVVEGVNNEPKSEHDVLESKKSLVKKERAR